MFGFSAQKTLQLAQNLYEKHKLISYPRTDSRFLTKDAAETLSEIIEKIREPYENKLAPDTGRKTLNSRFINDKRVSDHHAIIPTPVSPSHLNKGSDEAKIYDLICRRLLAAWHDAYITSVTSVTTIIETFDTEGKTNITNRDTYRSSGTSVLQEGWKVLDYPVAERKKSKNPDKYRDQLFPSDLKENDSVTVTKVEILKKKTEPPKAFNEGTLLTAMETAGKALEDKEISDAMKETGLGTPATRAAIIENLIAREYVERKGKTLFATPKGMHLIDIVHEHVKSPAMTGSWERRLKNIERGTDTLKAFMADITDYIIKVLGNGISPTGALTNSYNNVSKSPLPRAEQSSSISPLSPFESSAPDICSTPQTETDKRSPFEKGGMGDFDLSESTIPPSPNLSRNTKQSFSDQSLDNILKHAFGFEYFRPHQEAVCKAVTNGQDVLLVMPTGAGKSLCYQLPGIARGGSTLVISPLIALMDDQTIALQKKGFVAERIHSGMNRDASREVCRRYLKGELDFLFIAPERLGVPGFPEMLAKQMPSLIAVDEAHCISQWGHDFRPDYRMLKERLSLLRAAPIIAMTATATPIVQNDIALQLDMPKSTRFIHGFRRTNIAVEVVEMPQSARPEAILKLLKDRSARPAIVYAPTRKSAESLADELAAKFPAAAYHAGMSPPIRERVQREFLNGRLEVIVATIAFGMGIDKSNVRTVVHAALPGSIEGYYQEIGRAGRDGLPSKAVLMYTYADVKTHEFFLNRDYPEVDVLKMVYNRLTGQKRAKEQLVQETGLDEEMIAVIIEKLWIHGGADVSPDESVSIGNNNWQKPYIEQRRHKEAQLSMMLSFARASECRMLRLVRHFGDQEDSGEPCQCCDNCDPSSATSTSTRSASDFEKSLMLELLKELVSSTYAAKGKLFRDTFEGRLTRNEFETLVDALFKAGLIKIENDEFNKDGKIIEFQRLKITSKGYGLVLTNRELREDIRVTAVASPKKKTKKKSPTTASPLKKQIIPSKPKKNYEQDQTTSRLVLELKTWRLELARKKGIPAFRILTDRVLGSIAQIRPRDENALLQIPGVGDALLKNYGKQILKICNRS